MATKLSYAVVVNPVEDSTADNLRGLAELIDLAEARSMNPKLSAREGVLALSAEGTVDEAVAVALEASRSAIYPNLEVYCPACEKVALSLLEGTSGVHVLLSAVESPVRQTFPEPPDLVRIRRATGEAASAEEAARLLRSLGYTGPFEPAGSEADGGVFRLLLPHYVLPPALQLPDGASYELT